MIRYECNKRSAGFGCVYSRIKAWEGRGLQPGFHEVWEEQGNASNGDLSKSRSHSDCDISHRVGWCLQAHEALSTVDIANDVSFLPGHLRNDKSPSSCPNESGALWSFDIHPRRTRSEREIFKKEMLVIQYTRTIFRVGFTGLQWTRIEGIVSDPIRWRFRKAGHSLCRTWHADVTASLKGLRVASEKLINRLRRLVSQIRSPSEIWQNTLNWKVTSTRAYQKNRSLQPITYLA